ACFRTSRLIPGLHLLHLHWPSLVCTLPKRELWEFEKASSLGHAPPAFAVGALLRPDNATPSLHRHYSDLITTTSRSAPWLRFGTVGLPFWAGPFPFTPKPKVPAVKHRSPNQAGAAFMRDVAWQIGRPPPCLSRGNITARFRRHLITFDT